MSLQSPSPAPAVETARDRRSFVRLLLGTSLAASALALVGCESLKGQPVRSPYIHGGNGKEGRGGGRS